MSLSFSGFPAIFAQAEQVNHDIFDPPLPLFITRGIFSNGDPFHTVQFGKKFEHLPLGSFRVCGVERASIDEIVFGCRHVCSLQLFWLCIVEYFMGIHTLTNLEEVFYTHVSDSNTDMTHRQLIRIFRNYHQRIPVWRRSLYE